MNLRLSALLLLLPSIAWAQDYPAKPVKIVVPYSAGGNADILGRTLAQKLGDAMRQPFVVENRAGANGGSERISSPSPPATAIPCSSPRAGRSPSTPPSTRA